MRSKYLSPFDDTNINIDMPYKNGIIDRKYLLLINDIIGSD